MVQPRKGYEWYGVDICHWENPPPPTKQVPMDGSIVLNRVGCMLNCVLCCVELPWVSLVLLVFHEDLRLKEESLVKKLEEIIIELLILCNYM